MYSEVVFYMGIHRTSLIAGLFFLLLNITRAGMVGEICAADTQQVEECIGQYQDYVDSFRSFSYTAKVGVHTIRTSYNGAYCHMIRSMSDKPDYVYELNWDKCWTTLSSDKNRVEDPIRLLTYRDPSKSGDGIHEGLAVPELSGFVRFGPPLGSFIISDLLKSMPLKVSKERKNGVDLVLLSGRKEDTMLDVKACFDPKQKFALTEMVLTRTGAIQPGDVVSYSFSFDKYTTLKSVPLPTEHRWKLVQIHPDTGKEHVNTNTTYLSEFSITDNSDPLPFDFVTKVPNGAKVIVQDARQIEHIWYDGRVVPKTDEVMLAIARGGHKFMPGPDEPRFWFMFSGIALILFAGCKAFYDHVIKKKK